tara:strand:- start:406 stop:876 length:471 start_codon:yes stop_codon:yes gene_type:complete
VAFNTERGSFGGTIMPRVDSNGKTWLKAKAHGDLTAGTIYAIRGGASGLLTLAVADSGFGSETAAAHGNYYIGVPDDAVASGTFGWLQVGGNADSVTTTSTTGTAGMTFQWKDATIVGSGASDTAYVADFAVCRTSASASTSHDLFLLGRKVCGIT